MRALLPCPETAALYLEICKQKVKAAGNCILVRIAFTGTIMRVSCQECSMFQACCQFMLWYECTEGIVTTQSAQNSNSYS